MAMTKHLLLASAIVLAVVGYALIWLSCPYGGLAHIMTGLTRIPGNSILVPYRMILSFAVYLILRASYGYVRQRFPERTPRPLTDPLLLGCAGVGIAVIGFLSTSYPCPHPLSATLVLSLDIYIGACCRANGRRRGAAVGLRVRHAASARPTAAALKLDIVG
jgi:hypothetical protein